MVRSPFPTLSSVLSPDALLEQVIARYALPEPRHCRLISLSMNDTYRVSAGPETYYLRFSGHGWRTRDETATELAFILELRRWGLAVSPPMPRADGAWLTPLLAPEGERYAALFAAADGSSVRDITPRQSRAYGRLAAAIHTAADAVATDDRRFHLDERYLLDDPLQAVRVIVDLGGEDLIFVEQAAQRVRRCLTGLPRSSPAYGLCHGDLHPGNVAFDATGQPTLFDFDLLGDGWRSYDLSVFLWNAYGERRPKRWRESRWRAFLNGYQEVRPLPDGLDEVLPLFLVARQVWLMGLDCTGRSGWPPQWLNAQWLRDMVQPIRTWVAHYPILAA